MQEESFFNKIIRKPIKDNLSGVLFLVGLFLVFIGAIFGKTIDSWTYIPAGSGEAILKGGSAILGGGVFSIIMKSAQFTELFQEHVYNVFYNPENNETRKSLVSKWHIITKALLKDVLPAAHNEASKQIEAQFFDAELEYHFEDHTVEYNISIDDNKKATIKNISKTTIVLSPMVENPTLRQTTETDGEFKLLNLFLNGTKIPTEDLYVQDSNNSNLRILELPLKEYASEDAGGDMCIKMERTFEFTQMLTEDPYIKADIVRYIKGAQIKAKVSNGYKLHFENFGLGKLPENYYHENDGNGYSRWQLAESNTLLLPGQGYILVVVSDLEGDD